MPDLSLDDILAEIEKKRTASDDSKKASADFSVDDILGDSIGAAPKKRSEVDEKLAKRRAEQRAKEEAQKREEEEKARIKEEQRRIAEAQKREKERREAEERERKRREAAEAKKRADEEARRKREAELAEKRRREELKQRKAAEEAAEKKRLKEEEEQRKAEEAARIAALAAEEQEAARKEAERLRREEEESEKMFATKSIVFEEAPIELPKIEEEPQKEEPVPATTAELELEKELRRSKVEADAQKRLEKEIAMEDPDDFLSAFNPYDTGEKVGLTQIIETIPAKQLSGDTQGIAGGELKEIAKANAKIIDKDIEEIISGETMIMPELSVSHEPAIDLDKTFVLSDSFTGDTNEIPAPVKHEENIMGGGTVEIPAKKPMPKKDEGTIEIPPKKKNDDPLLASINRTIEQKRLEDIAMQSSRSVTEQLERVSRSDTQTNGFLIEIERAAMPQTGHIPVSDPVIGEQKIKSLASKRKRRITDFVLEDITDDDDFEYSDEDEDDFDITDDEGQIWQDLTETHKSLKLRFVLLLIITLLLCGITFAQELGASINFNLFGLEVNFLDKKFNTDGFIYLNLVMGVIGMGLCSSAITNGIMKLFKGKADCDSMVALSCALSLVGGVLHLSNTDYLQRSLAFLYIPAALAGLLFNTLGKLSMISRARKNFRFISADANRYYADMVEGESEVGAFTKGVVTQLPVLVTMRKTEYLTDFLRKSYCEDKADRISRFLAPASLVVGVVLGLLAYFIPNGTDGMENNIFWASSVMIGFVCLFAPFSVMFIVNNPLRRATKSLLRYGSTVLGYSTAEEYSETNAVMTDVSAIFPASSVECTNLKPCRLQNSINNISLDQAIILAASLAIKSGSILSRLFYEMIGGNEELIADIDGCVYEDNMGVMGWYGNKRLIMGNREHMKHHSIKVPEMSAITKYCRNGSDAVYLAVGGELTIIFFIRLTANPNIRSCLCDLSDRGVSLIVKTTDSLVTAGKIADLFDIDPEKIKVLGSNLHEIFGECTKYTSRGSGGITCNGTFTAFGRAILASKKLVRDVSLSQTVMLAGVFLAAVLGAIFALSLKTMVFSPAVIIAYNLFWMLPVLLVQAFRRY
ncbi:MAG: hypothetical protein IJ385_06880 [Ruminiclostridium sp.]|nr:hypothetical protein [Ruminiclostridium sp.]